MKLFLILYRSLFAIEYILGPKDHPLNPLLMKLGHNDHVVVGIIIYTWKWSEHPGGWEAVQMGSYSAKPSNAHH